MTTRAASHAGSWYTSNPSTLSHELDNWLAQVPSTISGKQLPIPSARIIIAPHAGYSYSGPAAAWAYASLSISPTTKRIFLLGPSHALYLPGCAVTSHARYATPLGNLPIDAATTAKLWETDKFDTMTPDQDETEHSLEMHLPYIHKILSKTFSKVEHYPKLVPILVGNTEPETEKEYGKILAPHLADPENVFVISSDFCHWGSRFNYTYYIPEGGEAKILKRRDPKPTSPKICDSIGKVDRMAMDAIETGKHENFLGNLKETGNTVCGRHPIGVVMAAVEVLEGEGKVGDGKGRFSFVRYERSSEVEVASESSVSYASAYAVL